MFETHAPWLPAWLLALTAVAAIIDARAGVIPNWLTLPTLLAAPLAHAAAADLDALGTALAAACVCGIGPLVLFCARGMGGGDVKLLAAIGALCGARLGLEVQLASYAIALLYACGALAWHRRLFATLTAALRLWRDRESPVQMPMTEVRLGPPVFCACVLVLACNRFGIAP